MRIHTNTLVHTDFHRMVADLPGVYVEVSARGSRSHARAFEIRLTGTSTRRTMDNTDQAATWDEWGVFFARLFNMDRQALAGSVKSPAYKNGADFHYKTGMRFVSLDMPTDTHQQHRWEYDNGAHACTKCSATTRR